MTYDNFEFLVSEYGYCSPEYSTSLQPNGVATQGKFTYERPDKTITITNAYHPNDYGFEINLTEKKTGHVEMLHFVLKENQGIEQYYLKKRRSF